MEPKDRRDYLFDSDVKWIDPFDKGQNKIILLESDDFYQMQEFQAPERLDELEEQQTELEQKIIIEKSKTAAKLTESEIRQFYEEALQLEPQLLVNCLIKRVVLYADKMEIHYNTSFQDGLDESQGFSFTQKQVQYSNNSEKLKILILSFIG